jgi:hypothetical protein
VNTITSARRALIGDPTARSTIMSGCGAAPALASR